MNFSIESATSVRAAVAAAAARASGGGAVVLYGASSAALLARSGGGMQGVCVGAPMAVDGDGTTGGGAGGGAELCCASIIAASMHVSDFERERLASGHGTMRIAPVSGTVSGV